MPRGAPDYTQRVELLGVDAAGNLVTVRLDPSGRIESVIQGQHGGAPRIIAVDAEGRMAANLFGSFGGTPVPVAVSQDGRLIVSEQSQSNIQHDPTEAQVWTTPLATLVSNLNRIRWAIVNITGEAWGTVSRSMATIWGRFHATAGHRHTGAENDAPPLDAGVITSGRFGMGRMPSGTAGHVLMAQGPDLSPAYASGAALGSPFLFSFQRGLGDSVASTLWTEVTPPHYRFFLNARGVTVVLDVVFRSWDALTFGEVALFNITDGVYSPTISVLSPEPVLASSAPFVLPSGLKQYALHARSHADGTAVTISSARLRQA